MMSIVDRKKKDVGLRKEEGKRKKNIADEMVELITRFHIREYLHQINH